MIVSVIIPSYQRFDQLLHCIDSVLHQTVKTEVIVIDDCSTDARYKTLVDIYPGIKVKHLPVNYREKYNCNVAQGLVRNEGILLATGEWIAFLDDDDVWLDTHKLQMQIYMMEKYDCLMSSTNMYCWNSDTKCILNTYYHPSDLFIGTRMENAVYKLYKYDISIVNYINTSTVILHSSIVSATGGFSLVTNEDHDYWLRAMDHTDCIYIHLPLVRYSISSVKYYG